MRRFLGSDEDVHLVINSKQISPKLKGSISWSPGFLRETVKPLQLKIHFFFFFKEWLWSQVH